MAKFPQPRVDSVERLGFFKLAQTLDEKGFIGAILVTDTYTKPLEFRVTFPVKPTPVQRTLYGASLIPHIGIELCGKPLYEVLENPPDILFIQQDDFLPLSERVRCLVVRVRPLESLSSLLEQDVQEVKLPSLVQRYEAIAAAFPTQYEPDTVQTATTVLRELSKQVDLLEPFERIEKALRALAEEDQRFR